MIFQFDKKKKKEDQKKGVRKKRVRKKEIREKDRRLIRRLRILYPVAEPELIRMAEKYRKEQIRMIVLYVVFLSGTLILLELFLHLPGKPIRVERNSYGGGEKQEVFYPEGREEIRIKVKEQEYTEEELERAFKKGFQYIRKHFLLENKTASAIQSDLNFMTEVPGGIQVEWIPEKTEIIESDGTVHNGNWPAARREPVKVKVLLFYKEEIRSQEIQLYVSAPYLTEEEKKLKRIREEIRRKERNSRKEPEFTIPPVMENVQIKRSEIRNQKIRMTLFITIVFILLLYQKEYDLNNRMKKRKKEVSEDYPVILNQLVLYMGAGMNIKAAFQKISEVYQKNYREGREEFRYAYQELYIMINQLKNGVPERKAYEEYAERIGENSYYRGMTLIVQNLKKGTKGLLPALEEEEEDAFKKRLEHARKLGEEAGIRLLFPMILMLIVVMAIIMMPAVFQFRKY